MKTKKLSLVSIPLPAYFSTLLTSQAVNPLPGGGYPGGNTAQGQNALLNLASGTYNPAIGCFSIKNKIGSFNTAVGAGTLFANTADNTATGAGALLNNTPGANNTVSGVFALFNNTTGASNTATGLGAKCPDLADLHPSPRSGLSYQTLVVTIEQKRIKK